MADALRRTAHLNLRLRPHERRLIVAVAASARERPSEWARRALLRAAQQDDEKAA